MTPKHKHTMKRTIEDYKAAVNRIYELATRPEGLRNVSGMGDRTIEESATALCHLGLLVKSGQRGPVTFMWNPTRLQRPTPSLYTQTMNAVLGRKHPEAKPAPGKPLDIAPGETITHASPAPDGTLFPMSTDEILAANAARKKPKKSALLDEFSAAELVEILRLRGYEVTCSRTETL